MTLQTKQILPKGILIKAESVVFDLFKSAQDNRLLFHNYGNSNQLVENIREFAAEKELPSSSIEMLSIAGWFYATGYLTDYEKPIEASIQNVLTFLEEETYPKAKTEKIKDFIRLIEAKKTPVSEEQEVFHDAFFALKHGETFLAQSPLLQLEQELFQKTTFTKEQWIQLQLQELLNTTFYTAYGKLTVEPHLANNILTLKGQLQKIKKKKNIFFEEEISSFQNIEDKIPARAIQTFFRANYRNHINLSAIADNKANIMISVNAILLSVLISLLTYKNITETKPMVLMSFIIFFITGLTSLVFAVLSARPKVTTLNKKLKDKNIIQKNIVFFGNFVNLDLDQYEEAMDAMFRDGELLYGNMVRDLYYLGKVLDKKYRYLTTSYNIFMVGFVATSLTLLVALLLT